MSRRGNATVGLLLLISGLAATQRPADDPPEPPRDPFAYDGDVVDSIALTPADMLSGTECVTDDVTPGAVLPPVPMPQHLSPADLPAHLALFGGLIYVDGPEAAEVAASLTVSPAEAEVWSSDLRTRGMTIRIGLDIERLAPAIGGVAPGDLGLFAANQVVLVDADATIAQQRGMSAPGDDTLGKDGVFWTPADTLAHELRGHYRSRFLAGEAGDPELAASDIEVANNGLWHDVMAALPHDAAEFYATDQPGIYNVSEGWADAAAGVATAEGLVGAARRELIGELMAGGGLNEADEQVTGAVIDAYFTALDSCGPTESLQYIDDVPADWAHTVGGGTVGKSGTAGVTRGAAPAPARRAAQAAVSGRGR